ncbi:hypothetical protein FB45DRAFT_875746 [Roridomyces roridus]|uniref:Uncharacterized protein n=1 Tax=Roridomyces roridus TaxID=1738132 RepID=A0AAD7FBN6_9AGAR|nr:hypothetical protein FB45DRAFT_875746 [Roridomyces roridus]
MPSVASFVAEVAEPPLPLIVPLAHTDFAKPRFPQLLMHEDLDDSPSLPPVEPKASVLKNSAPKARAPMKVAFSRPLSRSNSPEYDSEDLSLSKISLLVPLGGASHVKDADFRILTGWTSEFVTEFQGAVEALIAQKFKPGLSLSDQDPNAKAEIVAEILHMYPVVDKFVEYWPLEKVLIRTCKNSAAKETKANEKATLAAARILRSNRKT